MKIFCYRFLDFSFSYAVYVFICVYWLSSFDSCCWYCVFCLLATSLFVSCFITNKCLRVKIGMNTCYNNKNWFAQRCILPEACNYLTLFLNLIYEKKAWNIGRFISVTTAINSTNKSFYRRLCFIFARISTSIHSNFIKSIVIFKYSFILCAI